MDTSAMTHAMKDSISEVLEQMFFLPIDFIDPLQSTTAALDPTDVMATMVGFSGPASGRFRLTMPKKLAAAVTADFMGVQPDSLSVEQVAGTVKEMVNMLAGNTLSAYASQAVFDLEIPEMSTPANGGRTTAESPNQIDIGIQTLDGCMTFQLLAGEGST